MPTHSMPNLRKTKIVHKIRPILTKNQIAAQPYNTINHIFLSKIRKIAYPTLNSKTNQLISFLNLKHKSSNISLHYIPSIQNMISEQNIHIQEQGYSKSSIERGFEDDLISENNYELRIFYLCVLQKVMKKLQSNLSESQRRKIIRGTWNIFIKYCKDMNYHTFNCIGPQIQWGLLQLLNFNFKITPTERFKIERNFFKKPITESSFSFQLL